MVISPRPLRKEDVVIHTCDLNESCIDVRLVLGAVEWLKKQFDIMAVYFPERLQATAIKNKVDEAFGKVRRK